MSVHSISFFAFVGYFECWSTSSTRSTACDVIGCFDEGSAYF